MPSPRVRQPVPEAATIKRAKRQTHARVIHHLQETDVAKKNRAVQTDFGIPGLKAPGKS
jgi:hypothetical protein